MSESPSSLSQMTKELEKTKRRMGRIREQQTELQDQFLKMEAKARKYREASREKESQIIALQLQLKSQSRASQAEIKELNDQLKKTVPTSDYSSIFRKYEELRQTHEVCLKKKLTSDHFTIKEACVSLMQEALASIGPPGVQQGIEKSSASIKPQSSANRSRRLRRSNAAALRREMKSQGWKYVPAKELGQSSVNLDAEPETDVTFLHK